MEVGLLIPMCACCSIFKGRITLVHCNGRNSVLIQPAKKFLKPEKRISNIDLIYPRGVSVFK